MKTTLSFGLIVAAAGTMLACSDEEGGVRGAGGTSQTMAGGGGQTASGGSAGRASGGSSGQASGGNGGGSGVVYNYGDEATITSPEPAIANVEQATVGIVGGTFLAQSANMTVPATVAHRDGGLCFSGTTAVVPDPDSYGTFWGAELGLNLKLIPDPAAAPVADAGADAGAPELIVDPAGWPYGNVIGFSYKLVGNDEAAADKGVPVTRMRFKALPVGSNGETDTYCSNRNNLVDGIVENVLFDDITWECWNMAQPSIGPGEETINRITAAGPPPVVGTPPNPRALQNISWQIASDVAMTTPAPIAFNFCITELKPILAP